MMPRATAGMAIARLRRGRAAAAVAKLGKEGEEPHKERRHAAWMARGAPCGCGVETPPSRFDRARVLSMPSRRASQKRKVPGSSDGEPPLRG